MLFGEAQTNSKNSIYYICQKKQQQKTRKCSSNIILSSLYQLNTCIYFFKSFNILFFKNMIHFLFFIKIWIDYHKCFQTIFCWKNTKLLPIRGNNSSFCKTDFGGFLFQSTHMIIEWESEKNRCQHIFATHKKRLKKHYDLFLTKMRKSPLNVVFFSLYILNK